MSAADELRHATSLGSLTTGCLAGFFEGWPGARGPEPHLALLRGSGA